MSAASSSWPASQSARADAERRAGLVERAVGLGAAVVLWHPASVPERGGPVVALARVDLDHGVILRAAPPSAQPTGLKTSPVRTFGKK